MFRRGRGKTGAAGGKRVAYGNYGYGGLDNYGYGGGKRVAYGNYGYGGQHGNYGYGGLDNYAGYGGVGINRGQAGNRFRRRNDDDDNFARSRRGGSKGHSGGRFVPGYGYAYGTPSTGDVQGNELVPSPAPFAGAALSNSAIRESSVVKQPDIFTYEAHPPKSPSTAGRQQSSGNSSSAGLAYALAGVAGVLLAVGAFSQRGKVAAASLKRFCHDKPLTKLRVASFSSSSSGGAAEQSNAERLH